MIQQAPPSSDVGRRLGDRYILNYELAHSGDAPSTVWHAEDLALARPVAIRILCAAGDPASVKAAQETFVAAAMRGGRATHPALAAVFDAGVGTTDGAESAYAVVRWIDGVSLQETLRHGPLEPERAIHLLIRTCDAICALHDAGITHGRLHPGNVIISPGTTADDDVSVTDAVLAAAMHGEPTEAEHDAIAADTRSLGWLLHSAVTGYWPGPPAWAPELPAVPRDESGVQAGPRLLRGGITRELDTVVMRVIGAALRNPANSPIRTPAELRTALAALVTASRGPNDGSREDTTSSWWRTRRGRWALRLGSLVVLAGLGWVIGYFVGKVPNPPGSGAKPAVASSPSTNLGTAIPLTSVSAFDPLGDRSEDDSRVPLATDGNPATGWATETYQGGPKLGGKAGVGLLVDLGSAQSVKSVNLTLSEGGTTVELQAAPGVDTAPTTDSAFRTVATESAASGDGVRLVPSAPTTARYWVVWLTSLPPVANGYQGAIMEMTFLPTTATS